MIKIIKKIRNHYKTLPARPDYDGYLTLSEANDWYRNGNGEPLFVDLSKIDLSNLYSLGDKNIGDVKYVNLFTASNNLNDALVYGSITLKRYPGDRVKAYSDEYDFEMHDPKNPKNMARNYATKIGKFVAGKGKSYEIIFLW